MKCQQFISALRVYKCKNILITELQIENTLNDKRLLGTYAANKVVFCLWPSAIYLNSLLNKGLLRSSLLRISSDHWRGHIMGHQRPWRRFCTPWCSVAWRLPTPCRSWDDSPIFGRQLNGEYSYRLRVLFYATASCPVLDSSLASPNTTLATVWVSPMALWKLRHYDEITSINILYIQYM